MYNFFEGKILAVKEKSDPGFLLEGQGGVGINFLKDGLYQIYSNANGRDFPGGAVVENPPAMQGTWVDPWSRKIPHAVG